MPVNGDRRIQNDGYQQVGFSLQPHTNNFLLSYDDIRLRASELVISLGNDGGGQGLSCAGKLDVPRQVQPSASGIFSWVVPDGIRCPSRLGEPTKA